MMLRDEEGTIKVRNWIKKNIPANKRMHVQFYMNIRPFEKGAPQKRNAVLQPLVIAMDYYINTYHLNKVNPDYVFLHSLNEVKDITENPPPWHLYNYNLIGSLSGGTKTRNVYIFKKVN